MPSAPRPAPWTYAGLACVTLATLMHEILLTRIFSVTMWYHFAFMAISIVMFGMTVGSILVYLFPNRFPEERARDQLPWFALFYAITTLISFVVYLQIPFIGDFSLRGNLLLALSYVVIAVPFVLSGVVVSIALTRFPAHIPRLYGADLLGAAVGCIAIIYTLNWTDGPTAIVVVAALAAFGALLLSLDRSSFALRAATIALTAVLAILAVWHTQLLESGDAVIRIIKTRDLPNQGNLYVRWNSYSRVHVVGNPDAETPAAGWGLSELTGAQDVKIRQLFMAIDVWAGTVITHFTGDTKPLSYLKDDVTNIVHHVRPEADVMVIGVGGGRDVLSALAFDQKSVLGIEINENVLRATNEEFGDFAGHLDQHPKVRMVVDEARSYVARTDERFDIIQISLIDTWAATAAGALVLSENSLYTIEAWKTFLGHLNDRGVLSVSRWYFPTRPGEVYRLVALARETLDSMGAQDPRQHVVVIKIPRATGGAGTVGTGVGTMLLSRDPFSAADLDKLEAESKRLGFEVVLSPREAESEVFEKILSESDLPSLYASLPIDVSAPTDDRPFFFQMVRMRDFAKYFEFQEWDPNEHNQFAVRILFALVLIVGVLTTLCIVLPLAIATRGIRVPGSAPYLVYFLSIGLGFMFVEISQMQRLMVFLGHPTYALSVVLFTLLVGTGAGSMLSERVTKPVPGLEASRWLVGILLCLVPFGVGTPFMISALEGAETTVRIASASALLITVGLFLGMAFPLGMRVASARVPQLTPWLWGINGAAGVLCSVLAMAIALSFGIQASFWVGVACYVVALFAYRRFARGDEATA